MITEDGLRDEIFAFTLRYIREAKRAPNLGILSRRFGTASRRRFDKSVEMLLRDDRRFYLSVIPSGKTTVVVDDPEDANL